MTAAAFVARGRESAHRAGRSPMLFLLPAVIPVVVFSVLPLAEGIYLGFTGAKAGIAVDLSPTLFDNYARLLSNDLFWQSFQIGIIWAVATTTLQYVLGLSLALLMEQKLRFVWLVRTLALVPWATPPVIVAIMWRLIYQPDIGLLNQSLRAFGFPIGEMNWLADFNTAFPAVIIVGAWAGMAQTTVALTAGLKGIPVELQEAAASDGANAWQRFRHITWPKLRPVTDAIVSLNFIWNFNSFGLLYVLTEGGPGGKTMVPALFAYNEGFKYGHFGYAAAMGNVMVVVVLALLYFYLRSGRRSAE
ncbi:MAG: sugar ABC transporter permease [Candidatus Dormibacteraceae bacterium]